VSETSHIGFVGAAYALAGATLIGMIVAVLADYRGQLRALRRLEGAPRGPAPL
jgi:heme exporter protein CcmD